MTERNELHNRRRRMLCYMGMGAALLLLLFTGIRYGKNWELQQELSGKILRFHVLANSDTQEDQALKYQVRDAVGEKVGGLLAGIDNKEESREVIIRHMDEILDTAGAAVAEAGYGYTVEAFLAEVEFPEKAYGAYTFPAGRYEALEVVIGAGEGANWWCVMYPNLCFSGSVYEVTEEGEESLREVLSPEEYQAVLQAGDYQVRFKFLDFLKKLR